VKLGLGVTDLTEFYAFMATCMHTWKVSNLELYYTVHTFKYTSIYEYTYIFESAWKTAKNRVL